ncbi:hypothetical protein GCM10023336_44110 [Streptomyces similanensis]|uniref:Uncharacterized protein n=1 Tax=Streptomyces similanensis TaxID=1274988 RepID=A0ABP9KQY7_9ACTN
MIAHNQPMAPPRPVRREQYRQCRCPAATPHAGQGRTREGAGRAVRGARGARTVVSGAFAQAEVAPDREGTAGAAYRGG